MKRPNILWITSDQQHWNTIGAFNKEISTPNLDRLVREGTVFTRAYCPNPTCTPTRASMITGKYPSQHGAWSLGTKLPEDENTIGDELIRAGYRTCLIGKAHFQPLASTPEYTSLESYPILHDLDFWRNFNDKFYGFEHCELARNHTSEAHAGQHYAIWMEEKGLKNWRDYFVAPTGTLPDGTRHKWSIPEEFHYNAWIAERTNAMLEKYKKDGENFFLWASFFDPHPPYLVPEPWDTMYDPNKLTIPCMVEGEHEDSPEPIRLTQEWDPDFSKYVETGYEIIGYRSHAREKGTLKKDVAVYYAMISFMDKYIGKILDKLDELGLYEDTIVVFTTDHGHLFGQHGLIDKGSFHYEDLLKVPFIVRYPGKVPAGRECAALQSLVDLTPTLLGILGMKVPREMTGIDQQDVWFGKKEKIRDHVICEDHQEPTTVNVRSYVDERYKITVYNRQTFGQLFDLVEDPGEINNLWNKEEYRSLKEELLLKYIWAELEKEPMWMPKIRNA